jgi:hypothetical protein
MMNKSGIAALILASALVTTATAPAFAQTRKTACSKIFDMCMKRAGDGHAAICEDMYESAKRTGAWQATQEPDGTRHPPVPCTP